MKGMEKFKKTIHSTRFIVIMGLVVVPIISFMFIMISPESPLYTSISRIAWIHDEWFKTFLWAVLVMGTILWLTYKLVAIGPLAKHEKRVFLLCQFVNIALVFAGCLIFPAKPDGNTASFFNYVHDYLTAGAWVLYVIGLLYYSIRLRRFNKFLGFLGCAIMTFIIFSALFYIGQVVDPKSYVGASAVSEVYIINSLIIYLIVMYLAQDFLIANPSAGK